jgi:parallel beta-helix repeat protein
MIDCISGILLDSVGYTNISKNDFMNCESGIDFFQSDNNNVENNTFIKGGIVVTNSFFNNVNNNIINGRPLVYLELKSNIIINEAGQVILVNCNNITIQNLDLSNVIIGIELFQTNSCQILKNTFVDNYYGVCIFNSNNNNFSNNKISNHSGLGIFLATSCENIISNNNIFVDNLPSNGLISSKKNKAIISTPFFVDYLYQEEFNKKGEIVVKNIFEDSQGIDLINSLGNIISNNIIKNNKNGIILEISDFNIIEGNNIISNNRSGIKMLNSEDNSIIRNTISSCKENGIFFKNSNSNIINKNNFILNYQNAIFENSYYNRWNKNYWNRPRIFPKLIFGKIEIESNWIPWINIDWRPALSLNK